MVTLGFGFKSYVSYRMRLRKQRDVRSDNEFYFQLLNQALPPELHKPLQAALEDNRDQQLAESTSALITAATNGAISNGGVEGSTSTVLIASPNQTTNSRKFYNNTFTQVAKQAVSKLIQQHQTNLNGPKPINTSQECNNEVDLSKRNRPHRANINDFGGSKDTLNEQTAKSYKSLSMTPRDSSWDGSRPSRKSMNNKEVLDEVIELNGINGSQATIRNDINIRLESDVKRLKTDLQASRQIEQDLRCQLTARQMEERSNKTELQQLRHDNEHLQNKLHNMVTAKQQDKQLIASLEKRLESEKRQRQSLDKHILEKKKLDEEQVLILKTECRDSCKLRMKELESDVCMANKEANQYEDRARDMESLVLELRKNSMNMKNAETLMSALTAMEDKNKHLEMSLSAETKLKLDLFSALGECRRELELTQGTLVRKEMEVEDLKSKITEVMAVMPFVSDSSLDPNARVYQPKTDL